MVRGTRTMWWIEAAGEIWTPQDRPTSTTQLAPTNPSPTHFGHAQRTHHTPEPYQTWHEGLARPREGGD